MKDLPLQSFDGISHHANCKLIKMSLKREIKKIYEIGWCMKRN